MFTISATERQQFKRCRRMWNYGSYNRKSLTRLVTKKALALGTLIHNSLEQWLLNPESKLDLIFIDVANKEMESIQKSYREQVGAEISTAELEPFIDSVNLGMDMMVNYQLYWKTPLPKGATIVSPEQKINIDIGDDIIFECKFDGLVKDREGKLYILEHKTYSQRPRLDTLNRNDQFLAYIWAARQMGLGDIRGIAYDGMWKRNKPPRGSVLDDLFMRVALHRGETELREFAMFLKQEAIEMRRVSELLDQGHNEVAYTNHIWQGCFDCPFVPLCDAESNNEDTETILNNFYTLRKKEEDGDEDSV